MNRHQILNMLKSVHRPEKQRIVLFVIAMSILFTSPALAASAKFKCPPVPKNETVAIKKAGRYFAAGEKMAVKEYYYKALERYLCSIKMKPHPNTMFNIAQISKLLDNKKPALQLMKKFRNRNPDHPSVPEINELITKMETGDSLQEQPAPEETTEIARNAPSAEIEEIPAIEEPEQPAASTSNEAPRQRNTKRTVGVVLIVSGAAFTGIAIGSTIGASVNKSNALSANNYENYDRFESKYTNMTIGAVVSYMVGAGCLVSGIILLATSKPKKQSNANLSLSTNPTFVPYFSPAASGFVLAF